MAKSHSATLESILLAFEIVFGLYDVASDFIYYFYYDSSNESVNDL